MDVSPADVGCIGRLIIDGGIYLEALGYRERRGADLTIDPMLHPGHISTRRICEHGGQRRHF